MKKMSESKRGPRKNKGDGQQAANAAQAANPAAAYDPATLLCKLNHSKLCAKEYNFILRCSTPTLLHEI